MFKLKKITCFTSLKYFLCMFICCNFDILWYIFLRQTVKSECLAVESHGHRHGHCLIVKITESDIWRGKCCLFLLLFLLLCMTRSGQPLWIMKRGGLENSDGRLILLNSKRIAFAFLSPSLRSWVHYFEPCSVNWRTIIYQNVDSTNFQQYTYVSIVGKLSELHC